MRISDVFTLGGGYGNDGAYYDDYSNDYNSDNPCYSGGYPGCERPIGPFNYGRRGDRKGLAAIIGSSRDGAGLLGIFHRH